MVLAKHISPFQPWVLYGSSLITLTSSQWFIETDSILVQNMHTQNRWLIDFYLVLKYFVRGILRSSTSSYFSSEIMLTAHQKEFLTITVMKTNSYNNMVVKMQFQEYAKTSKPTTQSIRGPSSFAYDKMQL